MDEFNILWFAGGWLCGYVIRGFFTFTRAFRASAIMVEKTSEQALQLLGTAVYSISFMDQLYKQAMVAAYGAESGKVVDNEMEHEFNQWKKKAIEEFIESYPESYKWQIEFKDWDGAMDNLTDIYKRDKINQNGVQQK